MPVPQGSPTQEHSSASHVPPHQQAGSTYTARSPEAPSSTFQLTPLEQSSLLNKTIRATYEGFLATGYIGSVIGASWIAVCHPRTFASNMLCWHRTSSKVQRYLAWSIISVPGVLSIRNAIRCADQKRDRIIDGVFEPYKQAAQAPVTP